MNKAVQIVDTLISAVTGERVGYRVKDNKGNIKLITLAEYEEIRQKSVPNKNFIISILRKNGTCVGARVKLGGTITRLLVNELIMTRDAGLVWDNARIDDRGAVYSKGTSMPPIVEDI